MFPAVGPHRNASASASAGLAAQFFLLLLLICSQPWAATPYSEASFKPFITLATNGNDVSMQVTYLDISYYSKLDQQKLEQKRQEVQSTQDISRLYRQADYSETGFYSQVKPYPEADVYITFEGGDVTDQGGAKICGPLRMDADGKGACAIRYYRRPSGELVDIETTASCGSARLEVKPATLNGNDYQGVIESVLVCPRKNLAISAFGPALSGAMLANMFICFPAFIIAGLLLASMYYSGRDPLSLFDITTPKLPKVHSFKIKGAASPGMLRSVLRRYAMVKGQARRDAKKQAKILAHMQPGYSQLSMFGKYKERRRIMGEFLKIYGDLEHDIRRRGMAGLTDDDRRIANKRLNEFLKKHMPDRSSKERFDQWAKIKRLAFGQLQSFIIADQAAKAMISARSGTGKGNLLSRYVTNRIIDKAGKWSAALEDTKPMRFIGKIPIVRGLAAIPGKVVDVGMSYVAGRRGIKAIIREMKGGAVYMAGHKGDGTERTFYRKAKGMFAKEEQGKEKPTRFGKSVTWVTGWDFQKFEDRHSQNRRLMRLGDTKEMALLNTLDQQNTKFSDIASRYRQLNADELRREIVALYRKMLRDQEMSADPAKKAEAAFKIRSLYEMLDKFGEATSTRRAAEARSEITNNIKDLKKLFSDPLKQETGKSLGKIHEMLQYNNDVGLLVQKLYVRSEEAGGGPVQPQRGRREEYSQTVRLLAFQKLAERRRAASKEALTQMGEEIKIFRKAEFEIRRLGLDKSDVGVGLANLVNGRYHLLKPKDVKDAATFGEKELRGGRKAASYVQEQGVYNALVEVKTALQARSGTEMAAKIAALKSAIDTSGLPAADKSAHKAMLDGLVSKYGGKTGKAFGRLSDKDMNKIDGELGKIKIPFTGSIDKMWERGKDFIGSTEHRKLDAIYDDLTRKQNQRAYKEMAQIIIDRKGQIDDKEFVKLASSKVSSFGKYPTELIASWLLEFKSAQASAAAYKQALAEGKEIVAVPRKGPVPGHFAAAVAEGRIYDASSNVGFSRDDLYYSGKKTAEKQKGGSMAYSQGYDYLNPKIKNIDMLENLFNPRYGGKRSQEFQQKLVAAFGMPPEPAMVKLMENVQFGIRTWEARRYATEQMLSRNPMGFKEAQNALFEKNGSVKKEITQAAGEAPAYRKEMGYSPYSSKLDGLFKSSRVVEHLAGFVVSQGWDGASRGQNVLGLLPQSRSFGREMVYVYGATFLRLVNYKDKCYDQSFVDRIISQKPQLAQKLNLMNAQQLADPALRKKFDDNIGTLKKTKMDIAAYNMLMERGLTWQDYKNGMRWLLQENRAIPIVEYDQRYLRKGQDIFVLKPEYNNGRADIRDLGPILSRMPVSFYSSREAGIAALIEHGKGENKSWVFGSPFKSEAAAMGFDTAEKQKDLRGKISDSLAGIDRTAPRIIGEKGLFDPSKATVRVVSYSDLAYAKDKSYADVFGNLSGLGRLRERMRSGTGAFGDTLGGWFYTSFSDRLERMERWYAAQYQLRQHLQSMASEMEDWRTPGKQRRKMGGFSENPDVQKSASDAVYAELKRKTGMNDAQLKPFYKDLQVEAKKYETGEGHKFLASLAGFRSNVTANTLNEIAEKESAWYAAKNELKALSKINLNDYGLGSRAQDIQNSLESIKGSFKAEYKGRGSGEEASVYKDYRKLDKIITGWIGSHGGIYSPQRTWWNTGFITPWLLESKFVQGTSEDFYQIAESSVMRDPRVAIGAGSPGFDWTFYVGYHTGQNVYERSRFWMTNSMWERNNQFMLNVASVAHKWWNDRISFAARASSGYASPVASSGMYDPEHKNPNFMSWFTFPLQSKTYTDWFRARRQEAITYSGAGALLNAFINAGNPAERNWLQKALDKGGIYSKHYNDTPFMISSMQRYQDQFYELDKYISERGDKVKVEIEEDGERKKISLQEADARMKWAPEEHIRENYWHLIQNAIKEYETHHKMPGLSEERGRFIRDVYSGNVDMAQDGSRNRFLDMYIMYHANIWNPTVPGMFSADPITGQWHGFPRVATVVDEAKTGPLSSTKSSYKAEFGQKYDESTGRFIEDTGRMFIRDRFTTWEDSLSQAYKLDNTAFLQLMKRQDKELQYSFQNIQTLGFYNPLWFGYQLIPFVNKLLPERIRGGAFGMAKHWARNSVLGASIVEHHADHGVYRQLHGSEFERLSGTNTGYDFSDIETHGHHWGGTYEDYLARKAQHKSEFWKRAATPFKLSTYTDSAWKRHIETEMIPIQAADSEAGAVKKVGMATAAAVGDLGLGLGKAAGHLPKIGKHVRKEKEQKGKLKKGFAEDFLQQDEYYEDAY